MISNCDQFSGRENGAETKQATIEKAVETADEKEFNFDNTLSFPLFGSDYSTRELSEGMYKISGFVKAGNNKPITRDGFTREIRVGDKLKKVQFQRVNVEAPRDVDGQQLSKFTAIVKVDENPLPIALIVYAGIGATGLLSGGYFINSVNRFTGSTFNQFLTVAGLAASAYFAFFKK